MDNPYEKIAESFVYCVVCGRTEGRLEQHHVLYRSRGGEEEGNLVLLCQSCHARVHAERLALSLEGTMLSVLDKDTGEMQLKPVAGQIATGPSVLVDQARSVQDWLNLMIYADRLQQEPDEVLATLYDELRALKHTLWMVQAAIINLMQSRANYGDGTAKHVATALGCSERTVQSRGQIYREIISKPECAQACERLQGESWYREAVSSDDPIRWINHADERKVAEPRYTIAQFRAEMRTEGEESSLQRVVLYCEHANGADIRLAEGLKQKLGVPVELVFDESLAKMAARSAVRCAG